MQELRSSQNVTEGISKGGVEKLAWFRRAPDIELRTAGGAMVSRGGWLCIQAEPNTSRLGLQKARQCIQEAKILTWFTFLD